MKTKSKRKIFLTPIIIGIITVSLFYLKYPHQNTKQLSLEQLDNNNLPNQNQQENSSGYNFWFPKNNIIIVKKIKNSYFLKDIEANLDINFQQDDINEILKNQEISKKIDQLETDKFTKLSDYSGIFGNRKAYKDPYYILTYKKNNTICQLQLVFSCDNNNCSLNSPLFGCGDFDLDKDYQLQNFYYQIINQNKIKIDENNHSNAIIEVQKNPLNYHLVIVGSLSGVYPYFLNQQNQIVCKGPNCCDQHVDDKNFSGNWCTDDYETVETYQSI